MKYDLNKILKDKQKYLKESKNKSFSEKLEILGELQERFYLLSKSNKKNKKKKLIKPWNFK